MLAITPPWCDSPTPPNWRGYCVPQLVPPVWREASRAQRPCVALAQVKAVELGDVLSDDLALLHLADVLEVACDNITRMWPGGGGVGVVGRPHHVIHSNAMPAGDP